MLHPNANYTIFNNFSLTKHGLYTIWWFYSFTGMSEDAVGKFTHPLFSTLRQPLEEWNIEWNHQQCDHIFIFFIVLTWPKCYGPLCDDDHDDNERSFSIVCLIVVFIIYTYKPTNYLRKRRRRSSAPKRWVYCIGMRFSFSRVLWKFSKDLTEHSIH